MPCGTLGLPLAAGPHRGRAPKEVPVTVAHALIAAGVLVVVVLLVALARRLRPAPAAAEDLRFRRAARMTSAWSEQQHGSLRVHQHPADDDPAA